MRLMITALLVSLLLGPPGAGALQGDYQIGILEPLMQDPSVECAS